MKAASITPAGGCEKQRVAFGENVLGPVVAEFASRLFIYAASIEEPHATRLLFCARGGLRLRLIYERFLARCGLTAPVDFGDLMISRLVAARPALLAGAPAAFEEIEREFRGSSLRAAAEALTQEPIALDASWDARFDRHAFERLLSGDAAGAQRLRQSMLEQHHLFEAHFARLRGSCNRVILCDTGLYGSTLKLLALAMPEVELGCVLFARSNYKGFGTDHFARICGLSVEADSYAAFSTRTAVLRFWQLIEHVFEPQLDSVTRFDLPAGTAAPRSNLEVGNWQDRLLPREGELFAGVLRYIDRLRPETFLARIYEDSPHAWRALKRAIVWPQRADLEILDVGERARDFGRSEKVPVPATGKRPTLSDVRTSLWKEGAVVRAYPRLATPFLAGLECAHMARSTARSARRMLTLVAQEALPFARVETKKPDEGAPMRILHLANHCDEIGNGIMNVAVDLACEQARSGHIVAFASGGGSYVDLLRSHGVEHTIVRQHWRRPIKMVAGAAQLNALIAQFRPDIVHGHMMTGTLIARVLRGLDRFRLVATVHNEWQRTAVLMGIADCVIAVSDAVATRMAQRGIPRRKIHVVRNGPLNSPRRPALEPHVAVRGELGRPGIVTVCGLYQRKGIAELIEAFAQIAADYPSARLVIIGDGPDRAEFMAQAEASAASDRIDFLGYVKDPRPWLLRADIFVLASRSEPFGLVLAEAREAGCAIVSTEVGGIPEVLDDGAAGMLVPARDPRSLAAAIATLAGDPGMLQAWRERAQRNLRWLTAQRVANGTLALYSQILGRDPAAPAIIDTSEKLPSRAEV